MHFQGTDIPGVQLVSPYIWGDSRKFLTELIGLECSSSLPKFVQDNTSLSEKKHTLRGMHYQRPPHAQAKLVRCSQGELLDVVVDIRIGSPTFGKCNAVVV